MRSKNDYQNKKLLFIGIFLLVIIGITIGYAALQTTLSINGNTKIDKVGWDIHFENVRISEGSVSVSPDDAKAIIDSTDRTKLNYKVTLPLPGDYYEFYVDIVNAGTLPAKLNDINNTELTPEEKVYTIYTVTYDDNSSPKVGEKLAVGAKKTLKVRVEYSTDITAEQLPSTPHLFNLIYKLNYVQDK